MKKRVHVFVSGQVQGVFFRSEMRHQAEKLSVKGWVQNLPEGKVEAVFEGDEESLMRLVQFCRQGPPGALVTGLEVQWEEYVDEFRAFEIRH